MVVAACAVAVCGAVVGKAVQRTRAGKIIQRSQKVCGTQEGGRWRQERRYKRGGGGSDRHGRQAVESTRVCGTRASKQACRYSGAVKRKK